MSVPASSASAPEPASSSPSAQVPKSRSEELRKQFPDNKYPFHLSGDAYVRFMMDGRCYDKYHVDFAVMLCKLLSPLTNLPVRCSCCRKMVPISKICRAVVGDHLHLNGVDESSMIRDTGYVYDDERKSGDLADGYLLHDEFDLLPNKSTGDPRRLFISCEECDKLLRARDYMCKYQFYPDFKLCCTVPAVDPETSTIPTNPPVKLIPHPMFDRNNVFDMINLQEVDGNTKSFRRNLASAFGNMRHICVVCGEGAHVTETAFAWVSDHSHEKARHPGYSLKSIEDRKSLTPQTFHRYQGYGKYEVSHSHRMPTTEWEARVQSLEDKRLFIVCKGCRRGYHKWFGKDDDEVLPYFGTIMQRCAGCLGNKCLGECIVQTSITPETTGDTTVTKIEAASSSK